MAKRSGKDFDYYLTSFLTKYLAGERCLSTNTIKSYRDTFKLYLVFMETVKGIPHQKLTLNDFTHDNIVEYLDWLDSNKGIKKSSQNVRLAAIHSFVKYVQLDDLDRLLEYKRILAIKNKKHASREIPYLSKDELKALLDAPDTTTPQGRRDKVLLTVLYDTAARVSELTNLTLDDVRLSQPETISLTGKGDKTRVVPIMGVTVELLKKYIEENDLVNRRYTSQHYLFMSNHGTRLTRSGVSYILNKYVTAVNDSGTADIKISVHPHTLRHTKAVHLLEAGVDLIYIRDLLGHISVTTTEVYAKVSQGNKREALEKAYEDITDVDRSSWHENSDLMRFLQNLCKE